MSKTLKVSIVIPAYNEEAHLGACLEAIARQTVKPFEVIVVDNNSTDGTPAVASRYPFVRLVRELRQGPVYARDRGFNAARGEIIGRLDSDSIIAPDWVENVQKLFAGNDIEAVSGQVTYRCVSLPWLVNGVDRLIRSYLAKHMGALGEQFLYGSDMAIRRSAWQRARSAVCHKQHLHEDIDLAAHLAGPNSKVIFHPSLRASVEWRQAAAGPKQFLAHVWSNDIVFIEHQLQSRRYARRVIWVVSVLYPVIHLLYRGYDPSLERFSISYLFSNTPPVRVSPVSETL